MILVSVMSGRACRSSGTRIRKLIFDSFLNSSLNKTQAGIKL